jgi:glyoxylase-like metal-dependent hydrolase (beta-lactamase superfamily II)
MAVKEVGISFKQIDQIYITHCHPDHLGAARWMQRVCDAPVFLPREEIRRANEFIFIEEDFIAVYRQAIGLEAGRHGFPESLQDALVEDWKTQVTPLFRKPYEIFPIDDDDEIDLAGEKFAVITSPGPYGRTGCVL